MPQTQPTDYSPMYDFLYRIDKRIKYLEKDVLLLERQLSIFDNSKSNKFQTLSEELNEMHAAMKSLKDNFSHCIKEMTTLSKDLKNIVKKDEIQLLDSQVNDIKFEEFVTITDLKRGV